MFACSTPPSDPRAAIAARLGAVGAPPSAAVLTERLLLGQLPVACVGAKARAVTGGTDEDWRQLLLVAARAAPGACLTAEDGDALAAWAAPREHWRGARAEWLAARGDPDGAAVLLGPGGDDAARFRIALARGDGAAARLAAEGALVEEPRDVGACRTLASAALAEGDAAWAIECAACGGMGERAPDLLRLRADALDQAGETDAAADLYARIGADVHRAAILYQEHPRPEQLEEAARLLAPGPDGRSPHAALHALWMVLLHGGEPSLAGLDESLPAAVARAMARGDDADLAALADATGAPAAVARAYLHASRGDGPATEAALAEALVAAPASEPVHRARVALRIRLKGDIERALADWSAQDPDHVAATGGRGSRDLPWGAIVPDSWASLAARHPDGRMRADAPSGKDAIGERIRLARALPDAAARSDALALLVADEPGLDGLVAERYRSGPSPADLPDRDP